MRFSLPASQAERRVLADLVKNLLSDYASTPSSRREVTTEDVLTDDILDMGLQNLQESGTTRTEY
jgi:hypothetical protein